MAAKRRARRPVPGDSKESGRSGGNAGSDVEEEVEESGKRRARRPVPGDSKDSGRTGGNAGSDVEEQEEESVESGEMPLKQAKKPSPTSPGNAGAQGSGEATPTRRSPRGGAALKTTRSTRAKKPPPASQEGDDAGDSAGASQARNPLPDDDTADAGHNKRAATATPKRGEKRSLLQQQEQEEERPEQRAAGPDAEAAVASAPRRNKRSKRSAEKDRRKKKKKKQLRKALSKPTSPPQLLESGREDSREDAPSSPDIALDQGHNGREMAEQEEEQEQSNTEQPQDGDRAREEEQQQKMKNTEQEQSNTAPPQDEHRARGEQQQKKNIEQEHASDTSAPHDKDMHSPHGEEEQQKEVTNEEHADDTVNGKTLQGRNAPSTKPCGYETEKKTWSYDDELKILDALAAHAQSHDGALLDSSQLLANLTFDKIDANEEKLTDKIRKLKTRYRRWHSQGCPSDVPSHRLFKLSKIIWGPQTPYIHLDEDEQAEPTSRDFGELSKEYPHLAKEVEEYAETHSSGHIIMAMFMTIDDEKARDLDAKCKKQQVEAFKLELGKANLTNELLSALSGRSRV